MYPLIGLRKVYELLGNDRYRAILARDYAIDDKWFQERMGEIETDERVAKLEARLDAILNSTFWHLTYPLRYVAAGARRIAANMSAEFSLRL